eukprot:UN10492
MSRNLDHFTQLVWGGSSSSHKMRTSFFPISRMVTDSHSIYD